MDNRKRTRADTDMQWLSTEKICKTLDISPRTLEKWRAKGTGPRMVRLPNGSLRSRDDWFQAWLDELPGAA
jgi:predicted site-specific integrase-resolvase